MEFVHLKYGVENRRTASLRMPTGADEMSVGGTTYRDTVALVTRLLEPRAGWLAAADAPSLPVCDLDHLSAALFCTLYGEVADVRCACPRCRKPFEFAIPIPSLQQASEEGVGGVEAIADSRFKLPGGTVVRLPRIADVTAPDGSQQPRQAAAFVCTEGSDSPEAIENSIAALCPALTETVDTKCPLCDAAMVVDFDLPIFLMKSIAREREFLLREVHVLARAYGWSLSEILSLSRKDRHGFVRLTSGKPALRARSAA